MIIVHVGSSGPVEVARQLRADPGSPRILEEHFPPQPAGALERTPRARNLEEAAFLAFGDGARRRLGEATAAGATKIRVKITQARAPAKRCEPAEVDRARGHPAVHGRFAEADLAAILDHHATPPTSGEHRAGAARSLTQGTGAWAAPAVHERGGNRSRRW